MGGKKQNSFKYVTNAVKLREPNRKHSGQRTPLVNSQCEKENIHDNSQIQFRVQNQTLDLAAYFDELGGEPC